MVKIGYARVSTVGQTLDMQVAALKNFGCTEIFKEKASGANADRNHLKRMIKKLNSGDTVVVTRIDRISRSTFDLFDIVKKITERKSQFLSLAEPWADTSTSTGRLMLAVLGGLADVERDLIRTRTVEGRARAVEKGVRMGRPSKVNQEEINNIIIMRKKGIYLKDISLKYNIGICTVSRICRKHDNAQSLFGKSV